MNVAEGWNMYSEIQSLKDMHFNVSQISKRLDLSRTTVYKYLNLSPDEMELVLESQKKRTKKLDKHRDLIRSWLTQYPDMTSAQVLDWLQERKIDGGVSEGTVRNYVNQLRKECGIPKIKDGNLVIVPEEAEIVKRIYREYLEGSSMLQIARGLEADGILTGAGNHRWHTSTINKILRNEKYIGDALLQKTYTVDFLSKKRVANNGIVPQYYVENSHEPIIPREIYMQVQEELVRRRCVHISKNGKKRNYSNNHPLSQMVFCGKCHEVFRRVHWNNRGKKSIVWRCVSRLENTGLFCTASTIKVFRKYIKNYNK